MRFRHLQLKVKIIAWLNLNYLMLMLHILTLWHILATIQWFSIISLVFKRDKPGYNLVNIAFLFPIQINKALGVALRAETQVSCSVTISSPPHSFSLSLTFAFLPLRLLSLLRRLRNASRCFLWLRHTHTYTDAQLLRHVFFCLAINSLKQTWSGNDF